MGATLLRFIISSQHSSSCSTFFSKYSGQQQENNDDSDSTKVESSAKPSSDDMPCPRLCLTDRPCTTPTRHPRIFRSSLNGSWVISDKYIEYSPQGFVLTNEETAGHFSLARLSVLSRKQGLWEEYVAKLTGKEVNQEAVIGGSVCRIDEAEEPSDVLWENIDASIVQRYALCSVPTEVRCVIFVRLMCGPRQFDR